MKFLFDQNVSFRILRQIPKHFNGSSHVKSENLVNASDQEIWEYAKNKDFVIVTQDSDFNDLNLLYGFPPKIIWLRTGNMKTSEIVQLLMEYFNDIEAFINDADYGCFEISKFKE